MRFFKKFYEYGSEKKYDISLILSGYSQFLYELSQEDKKFDTDFLDATYNALDNDSIEILIKNAIEKEKQSKKEDTKKAVEDAKALAQSTLYGYLSHIHEDIKYVLKTWYLCILLIIIFFAWRLIAYPESLKLVMSVFKKIFCSIITFIF